MSDVKRFKDEARLVRSLQTSIVRSDITDKDEQDLQIKYTLGAISDLKSYVNRLEHSMHKELEIDLDVYREIADFVGMATSLLHATNFLSLGKKVADHNTLKRAVKLYIK